MSTPSGMVGRYARSAIRRQILDAFVAANPDHVETKGGMIAARSAAGLPSFGDLPADQPHYAEIENMYLYVSTAAGARNAPALTPAP